MKTKKVLLFIVLPILTLAVLVYKYWHFTLDDAYITFRYAENVAHGFGAIWNKGGNPVEGYTSFLWVVIHAIGIRLGVNPVLFSKIISVIATCGIISVLYSYAVYQCKNYTAGILAAFAIGLSPAFVLLTVQGMETTVAGFFVVLLSVFSLNILQHNTTKLVPYFSAIILLSILTRPDLIMFNATLLAGMLWITVVSKQFVTFRILLFTSFLFVIMPGIIYFIWRYSFYGYLLPNTFYVKNSKSLISLPGIMNIFEFLTILCGPYIILIGIYLAKVDRLKLKMYVPLTTAVVTFLLFYFFIDPIQGFLYRFQAPIFPAILLLFVEIVNLPTIPWRALSKNIFVHPSSLFPHVISILLSIFIAIFPFVTYRKTNQEVALRTQDDRVTMGRALQPLVNNNYNMLVTESGALPFYSQWDSSDTPGLTDEYITHNGLDNEYFKTLSPELVMVLIHGHELQNVRFDYYQLLIQNNYRAVAAIEKHTEEIHLYFVKNDETGDMIAPYVLNTPLHYLNPVSYIGDIKMWSKYNKG